MSRTHSMALACLILCFQGCADLDLARTPPVWGSRNDGGGLPDYLAKRQSQLVVVAAPAVLRRAAQDSLLALGCREVREHRNGYIGHRAFIPGLVCGVGGETLYVQLDEAVAGASRVSVTSYSRSPYPAATRLLDRDACDLIRQLVEE